MNRRAAIFSQSQAARRLSPTVLLTLSLIAAATGCGGRHDSSVHGAVTLDGQPLRTGTVTFHPAAGAQPRMERIAADGQYTIKTGSERGLDPGEYRVTVVAIEMSPAANANDAPSGKRITPAAYQNVGTTPLTATVTAGGNQIDLAVASTEE